MDSRTVGIIGGGQLGRMMAEAALRIGVKCAVLDPMGKESPAGQVAELAIEGACMLTNSDEGKTRELAAVCDLITIEIEHVDVAILEAIDQSGTPVHPSPATIRMIQDKLQQKQHLAKYDIALPDFMDVPNLESMQAVGDAFGFPFMLKSRTGAYDGNGNYVVKSADNAAEAFKALGGSGQGGLYAERWVPFEKELAVMVARSATEVQVYPIVETTQKDNICHTVVAPARLSPTAVALARDMAERAITSFDGHGIFGIEMFLLKDGRVLLNEIAPRPHNSGHYTMEACPVDQFENHLRAILGLPLGKGEMDVGAAIMLNVLGEPTMEETNVPLRKALENGKGGIHWYGKASARKGRKMAHCTFVGPTLAAVQRDAESIGVATFPPMGPSVGIIMGSDSDLPTMKAAAELLDEFGVPYEITIVSAHRTPERMFSYAKEAPGRGIKVIIAGAGGAAHLPGMVAALTPLPVIGVPVKSSSLSGVDSLYSIVQMPRGIPVATVAIGNALNAGLLAVRMLSIAEPCLLLAMEAYMKKAEVTVTAKAEKMTAEGLRYEM